MEKARKTSKFGKFQYIVYIYIRFVQLNFRNFHFLSLRIFFISSIHIQIASILRLTQVSLARECLIFRIRNWRK